MDELARLLRRATAPPPADLAERVATAIRADGPAPATTDIVEDDLIVFGPEAHPDRRHHRLLVAAVVGVALLGATVVVITRRDRPTVVWSAPMLDPGGLPARIVIGQTPWTLTWVPHGYEPTSGSSTVVVLRRPGASTAPAINVSATQAEDDRVGEAYALGPLGDARYDPLAQTMGWRRNGWTLSVAAPGVPQSDVLARIIAGITKTSSLEPVNVASNQGVVFDLPLGKDYRTTTAALERFGFIVRWAITTIDESRAGQVTSITPNGSAKKGSVVVVGVVGVPGRGPGTNGRFFLSTGDLPQDPVGYMPEYGNGPVKIGSEDDDIDQVPPIVFLHGELVGYGVGEQFISLRGLATAAGPVDQTPGGTASTDTSAPHGGNTDLDAFCAQAAAISGDKPESYVGSAQHIRDITNLAAVAPRGIRDAVNAYRLFLANGGVDPADPDSNLTTNWPAQVQTAVRVVQRFINQHCP